MKNMLQQDCHMFAFYSFNTPGSGNAVAFTGMAAELGMAVSRIYGVIFDRCLQSFAPSTHFRADPSIIASAKDYLLLAGAGSGVSANFDTPFAGVVYAYEVIKKISCKHIVQMKTNYYGLQL